MAILEQTLPGWIAPGVIYSPLVGEGTATLGYFEWGQIVRLHEFVTPARLGELEEAARLLETAGFQQQAQTIRVWAKELAKALESESSPPTELWWG